MLFEISTGNNKEHTDNRYNLNNSRKTDKKHIMNSGRLTRKAKEDEQFLRK